MMKPVLLSSIASALTTTVIMLLVDAVAPATAQTQPIDHIRVRGITVVDIENRPVVSIGNDPMNGLSGIWIGGPRTESQQIHLVVDSSAEPGGSRKAFIVVSDDIRSVRNDPAVLSGHAGGPVLWKAP